MAGVMTQNTLFPVGMDPEFWTMTCWDGNRREVYPLPWENQVGTQWTLWQPPGQPPKNPPAVMKEMREEVL